MSLLKKLIRVAHVRPETRKHLVPVIKKAMEFPTEDALKKYLKEHPKADKSKHTVTEGAKDKPKPLSKAEHTKRLPGGTKVRVYDAGPKAGLDRYTVVADGKDWDSSVNPGHKAMLGLSEGGRGVSQFSEGKEGPHLGKTVKFDDLDKDTRDHIIHRLEKEGD